MKWEESESETANQIEVASNGIRVAERGETQRTTVADLCCLCRDGGGRGAVVYQSHRRRRGDGTSTRDSQDIA